MIKIRAPHKDDIEFIKTIHEKYYASEFNLPDFINKFICSYVVEKDGTIISVAGVRTLVEAVAVTNKDLTARDRVEGLIQILQASKHFARVHGYSELHAFVQDDAWKKHLETFGFHPTKGEALVLEV